MKKEISTECAKCHRDFIALIEYHDVLEYPTNLIPIYCEFCEKEMKSIGKSWIGTITAASIPQRNVEGLEESLQTLATSIVNARDEFRAFKKYAEYDIEQNTNNIEKIRALLIALHIMVIGLFIFDLGIVWYIIKH